MGVQDPTIDIFSSLNDEDLADWEDAYGAVESYLLALRLKNKLLVAELTRGVLLRAYARNEEDKKKSPRLLALDEVITEVGDWTQQVLDETLENRRLAARGRLALLLAGMPDKWQSVFLTPAPWPKEFVDAMKQSYLAAGPQFAEMSMAPHPLELNVIGSGAAQWRQKMESRPIIRYASSFIMLTLLGLIIWFLFLD